MGRVLEKRYLAKRFADTLQGACRLSGNMPHNNSQNRLQTNAETLNQYSHDVKELDIYYHYYHYNDTEVEMMREPHLTTTRRSLPSVRNSSSKTHF